MTTPPAIQSARRTRHILILSLISGIAAGASLLPKTTLPRTLILVGVSILSGIVAATLMSTKVREEGWLSIKEPPVLASLAILLPAALAVLFMTALILFYYLSGGWH